MWITIIAKKDGGIVGVTKHDTYEKGLMFLVKNFAGLEGKTFKKDEYREIYSTSTEVRNYYIVRC